MGIQTLLGLLLRFLRRDQASFYFITIYITYISPCLVNCVKSFVAKNFVSLRSDDESEMSG